MPRPLDGIVVLDFSRVLAAPMATQILADLGAEVIKVERPGTGDETRSFEPRVGDESAYFFAFNRGKRSVTLDLKSPEGCEAARALAARADVVVENFLPGTMAGLGLGYDELAAANPELVYVAATGFGQTGPESSRKGYDTVFQALSGIMGLTGDPAGGPSKTGVPIADLTSGLWVTIAALSGLVGRWRHGHGTFVDVAMMDVQTSMLALAAARVFALGEDPGRTGTEHPGRVPSAAFRAHGGWLHISASDQHWLPLCDALGLGDLAQDEGVATNAGRLRRRDEIMTRLRTTISERDRDEVVAVLSEVGVPVGEVRTVKEALATPQVRAREMVGSFEHPTMGSFPALRTPVLFSAYDTPGFAAPPVLGADTAAVLSSLRSGRGDGALTDDGEVAS